MITALITAPMFASQRVEINCGLEAQATLLKTDFIREKFQVFKPRWIKQELIQLGRKFKLSSEVDKQKISLLMLAKHSLDLQVKSVEVRILKRCLQAETNPIVVTVDL